MESFVLKIDWIEKFSKLISLKNIINNMGKQTYEKMVPQDSQIEKISGKFWVMGPQMVSGLREHIKNLILKKKKVKGRRL